VCHPIATARFWMMSSNVSGLFRWGYRQRCGLIAEDAPKQRFRLGSGIDGRVAVCGYLLLAGIVKAVTGAGIELERDVAAEPSAALHQPPANPRRGLLVGGAVEGEHRGIGPVALCVKMSAQAAGRVKYQCGTEADRVGAARRIGRHRGQR